MHGAGRRHFDLRLQIGGVLVSFALPKGPSLDPSEKRFAVRTEDHPMEYADFEGVIPEGSYGAGPMILWDRGRTRYLEGPAEEELERGKLYFELQGYKLRGRFALVRMKKEAEWLFFKKEDAFAMKGRDIAAEEPRSILGGLTTDELANAPALARDLEERAAALGAPRRALDWASLVPMACSVSGAPEASTGWIYELKLDGVRALTRKDGGRVSIKSRRRLDMTAAYPEVARAMAALAPDRVIVDGEIVTFDESGQPSFQRLAKRIHRTREHDIRMAMVEVPVVYALFDLLAVGDRDLTRLPLVERKALLRRLLPAPGVLRVLDHLEGDGRPLYAFCKARGLEGVVAKRAISPYRPGPSRSPDWVKMKCERDDEFVVVGFTRGEGSRELLGALDVATWEDSKLVYRGKVGSGLNEEAIGVLLARLRQLEVSAPSATGEYATAPRGRTHVRPEVVVSVRFFGWSDQGQLWHPTFRGIRDDIEPRACTAAPKRRGGDSAPPPPNEATPTPALVAPVGPVEPEGAERRVAITNKTKVLFPGEGITKGDLCGYYRAIAPVMLPHLRDRPVMIVRYPDGITGKFFYQWNVPAKTPPWIRTCKLTSEEVGGQVEVFVIDSEESLVFVANLAAIPVHILASRAGTLDECDFLTIDFDVKNASLAAAVELALDLRELLGAIGLEGYPKTSGQSGLHVFVPLGPGISYTTARMLADLLGHLLVQRHPATATMERVIAKRGSRVYVDTGQTGASRTIAAPYSVRAQPGATVSTPLRWDELNASLDPSRFTVRSVPERVEQMGDPMAPMLTARPSVIAAVARMEEKMRKQAPR